VVRFAEAAREAGLPTVFGAECSPAAARRPPLVIGARRRWSSPEGGRRAARRGGRELQRLVAGVRSRSVLVELWDHGDPLDSVRNDALAELAARARGVGWWPPTTCTTPPRPAAQAGHRGGRGAGPPQPRRARRGCRRPPTAHLRSGAEQARRFARYPGWWRRRRSWAWRARSTCRWWPRSCRRTRARRPRRTAQRDGLPAPALARAVPPSATATAPPGTRPVAAARAWRRSTTSWTVIEARVRRLLPGRVGHRRVLQPQRHLCQGRGSGRQLGGLLRAGHHQGRRRVAGLLFERFLSPERDGPPDIDIDIESDRREEVIQYVYERYGRTTPPRWPT
jgi:error-prone DNA polymerase